MTIPDWAPKAWRIHADTLRSALPGCRASGKEFFEWGDISSLTGMRRGQATRFALLLKKGLVGDLYSTPRVSQTPPGPQDPSEVEAPPVGSVEHHTAPPKDARETAPTHPTLEVEETDDQLTINVKAQHLVMNFDQLIEVSKTDLKAWRCERHRVNTWTTAMKDNDGEPMVVRNWQVKAEFQRRMDQEFKLPTFAEPLKREPRPVEARRGTALVIGDPQMGFRRNRRGALVPLHDRRVLDVALQIAAVEDPEFIVFTGDMFDFAELSTKFPRPVDLVDTTDPSLGECRFWLASFRKTCPSARILILAGNHDERIDRALMEKVPVLRTLKAPGDTYTALAIPRLLGLDDMDVEWVGPYGASAWLWDAVEGTHGDVVRAPSGGTVAAVAKELHHSRFFGHVHRAEVAWKTIWGPYGPRNIFAATPGCACRLVEGLVPGFKIKNNWQQALMGITYDLDEDQEHLDMHLVARGRCFWRGELYEGRDQTEAISEATGWPMERDWLKPGE